jgi:hypothetical protein
MSAIGKSIISIQYGTASCTRDTHELITERSDIIRGTRENQVNDKSLWEISVYVFSVEESDEGDDVTLHNKTNTVITYPDTKIVAAASKFLEVGHLLKMLRLFNELN